MDKKYFKYKFKYLQLKAGTVGEDISDIIIIKLKSSLTGDVILEISIDKNKKLNDLIQEIKTKNYLCFSILIGTMKIYDSTNVYLKDEDKHVNETYSENLTTSISVFFPNNINEVDLVILNFYDIFKEFIKDYIDNKKNNINPWLFPEGILTDDEKITEIYNLIKTYTDTDVGEKFTFLFGFLARICNKNKALSSIKIILKEYPRAIFNSDYLKDLLDNPEILDIILNSPPLIRMKLSENISISQNTYEALSIESKVIFNEFFLMNSERKISIK